MFTWGNNWPPRGKAGNFADETAKSKFPHWTKIIEGYKDGYAEAAPVGRFDANPYGLYDLSGNVCEWCRDWYGDNYYESSPASDPQGPDSGEYRVWRGGSWTIADTDAFRCAYRGNFKPGYRDFALGFRVVYSCPMH